MAKKPTYKFIDLFAGIGGFHVAFNNTGRAQCEFASEWDPHARKSYRHWFNKGSDKKLFKDNDKRFAGDITKVNINEDIPDFDILCGGFPCQPFSQAGQKKGFSDTRGTLFFNIEEIIKIKKPRAFFLENVRGLINHGGDSSTPGIGKTMETILHHLYGEKSKGGLGYHPPVGHAGYFYVKASDHGLPQHRPRVFIIGFRDKKDAAAFTLPPKIAPDDKLLGRILGGRSGEVFFDAAGKKPRGIGFTLRCGGKGSHIEDRRNWEHYYVKSLKDTKPKILKINEAHGLLLNGFPEDFKFPAEVGKTQRMKQLGNSVAVNAIQAWAESIIDALDGQTVSQTKGLELWERL
jgi:DNA (cytosine-5)-methyltransferase 1